MSFSQRLHILMDDKGITAYRLSKELGVHQTTISNWLRGKTVPNITYLKKIADALGVSLSHLIGYEEELQKITETVEQVQRQYNDIIQPEKERIERALKPIQDQLAAAGLGGVATKKPDDGKNASESDYTESEAEVKERVDTLTKAFESCGYIAPGGDLTDEQLRFCMALVDFLDKYFGG